MSCPHNRTEPWRRGAHYPDRAHGPEVIRTTAGETIYRSWTTCLDCGTHLERSLLTRQADLQACVARFDCAACDGKSYTNHPGGPLVCDVCRGRGWTSEDAYARLEDYLMQIKIISAGSKSEAMQSVHQLTKAALHNKPRGPS